MFPAQDQQLPPGAPSNYKQLTEGGQRMSLDCRFRTGRADLDNKALVDLHRVVGFLTDLQGTRCRKTSHTG
jgi:hypothetical protein